MRYRLFLILLENLSIYNFLVDQELLLEVASLRFIISYLG